jgi:hypothetical protein
MLRGGPVRPVTTALANAKRRYADQHGDFGFLVQEELRNISPSPYLSKEFLSHAVQMNSRAKCLISLKKLVWNLDPVWCRH